MSSQTLDSFVEVEAGDDVTVVRFTGQRLDHSDLGAVAAQWYELADRPGCRRLHLDLVHVARLDVAALAKLLTLSQKLRSAGSQLTLLNVGAQVFEHLRVTHLDRLLDVRPKATG